MNKESDYMIAKSLFNNFNVFAIGLIFGIISFVVMGNNAMSLIILVVLIDIIIILIVEIVSQVNKNRKNNSYDKLRRKLWRDQN